VDDLDRQLLRLLREHARMPIAELGRRVGLSRTAALARVRRLEDTGTIRGYHADVTEPETGASHEARVGIVTRGPDTAAYAGRLRGLPEVCEIETVAGEYDLIVRVATASGARLDAVLDRINAWPQTVRTTTWVVLNRYGS
jgi:Lrp/AsnC family transcriptional regulator, leucine-responsive regulatory protein